MKNENSAEFVVVGIGASTGGIHSLRRFFSKLSADHLAIVIVQHKIDREKKLTIDMLRQITDLPIDEVVQGNLLTAGRIYIAPSETLVSIQDGTFILQSIHEPPQKYATIDWFFESIAKAYKTRAVGIIFSGEGADGTLGLKAIGHLGGLTLAQEKESAEEASMPQFAADYGTVDHITSPESMPRIIENHIKYIERIEKNITSAALHEQIGAAVISICDVLLKYTHHDFKHYKTSTLVRRIQRRMLVLQITDVEEYVEVLRSESKERDLLFNDLLINVTSFFRDPEAFDALKNEVLAKLLPEILSERKFRIWVAGCSTGEEAYTLAILVRETMEALSLKGEVQIIATDIDEDALSVGRKGEYPLSISEKISPERLEKYFQRRNGRFSVSKQLREMILFSSHNLINDPPFSQIDLISCRNVLIYLGMHLQKKLIPVFHYALRPNGYLFLGTSEALGTHKELFFTQNAKYRIAQRKATAINHPAHTFLTAMSSTYSAHFKEAPQNTEEDLLLIGQRIVLDEFAPKFAIVNEDLQILTISAGFNEYLEPGGGAFHNNITRLVKQNLRTSLRTSLGEAKKHKRQISHHFAMIPTEKGVNKVGIVVQPMPQLGDNNGLYMVVFRDLGYVGEDSGKTHTVNSSSEMVEELEKELAHLRVDLEKTVQELEASNEELKSSNEELLSMNEELQSANEELEISKDEIQRTNEILMNSNIDLENLLSSTKIATIFLDDALNIRGFTPAVSELYDLVEHDIGRSINTFTSKAINMPAYKSPKDLKPDQVIETEVQMPDGRIFLRRKSAYMNRRRQQVGLVITFVDVTELRRSETTFKTLANTVPQMIWMTDADGNYIYFSSQWKEFTGLDPATIKNKGFRDRVHPEDVSPLITSWDKARRESDSFEFQCRFLDKNNVYHWHLIKALAQKDLTGRIYRWCGTCTNIQSQKELELSLNSTKEELVRNAERFNRVAEAVELGVWYCDLPLSTLNWTEIVKKHFWLPKEEDVTIETFFSRLHPDDRTMVQQQMENSITKDLPYDCTYRTMNPETGELKWIRAVGWTDKDEKGSPCRFDGITLDITQMTNLIESLQVSETRYSLASKATRELIWDWNLITDKVIWNEALSREMGYAQKELNSDAAWWYNHIHPDDRERVVNGIHVAIDNKEKFWSDEYRFQRADGSYAEFVDHGYIQTSADGKALRMIGSMLDITERNEYLKQMHQAVNARDEFLSIASHELKTPITSMMLKIQLMQRQMQKGIAPENAVEKTNEVVLKQCRLLTSLIDDMLDVSRIATGRMKYNLEHIDLHMVVSHAIEVFSGNFFEKDVQLEKSLEDNLIVEGDQYRLEQVFYNLLSNALKYGLGRPIRIDLFRDKKDAVIRVSDQGIGIPQEDLCRIFNRFERAVSSKISGLGLGLYISKEIIDAHDGKIQVESKIGEGSVFTVRLRLYN